MSIHTLLTKHNIRPQKKLGQCFLADPYYINAILDVTHINSEDVVIEVGPGVGTLTNSLIGSAAKVILIEFDEAMIRVLKAEGIAGQCTLLEKDVLDINWNALASEYCDGRKAVVVGNLPYGIATEIIFRLLETGTLFKSLYLTIQKEVAKRIVAKPGTKAYGILSVLCQLMADVELLVEIPGKAFYPTPKVDSMTIGMWPASPERFGITNTDTFSRVVHAAFQQKRKTLLNSLSNSLGVPLEKSKVKAACETAGIDSDRRAETLTIKEFGELTKSLGDSELLT